MSQPVPAAPESGLLSDRLLAFELGQTLYALPIADIAEVTELDTLASVPMVHRKVGGVVNHHGDAVPIVYGDALFGVDRPIYQEHRPLLILAKDPDDPNRYGVPVDRIHGLVDGPPAVNRGEGVVAERRPHDGRMISVLDPASLLDRAKEVIGSSVARTATAPMDGGV